jgi:hypothetical protein
MITTRIALCFAVSSLIMSCYVEVQTNQTKTLYFRSGGQLTLEWLICTVVELILVFPVVFEHKSANRIYRNRHIMQTDAYNR